MPTFYVIIPCRVVKDDEQGNSQHLRVPVWAHTSDGALEKLCAALELALRLDDEGQYPK